MMSSSALTASLAVFVGVAVVRSSVRDATIFAAIFALIAHFFFGKSPDPKKKEGRTAETGGSSAASKAYGEAPGVGKALMLHITGGPLNDKLHRVTTAGATCGRHTSNAIVLPEAAVSRHHFSIEYKALEGRYFLIDEGSTTGTFMFLRPSEPFQLAQDMCIRAGATELVGPLSTACNNCSLLFTRILLFA